VVVVEIEVVVYSDVGGGGGGVGGSGGSVGGGALEPTISELLTVTRGHAIFHTEIDNRQSTEMIYVTDTGPTSAPSNSRPSVPRIFLITVPHMKLHFAPSFLRSLSARSTIIHLG